MKINNALFERLNLINDAEQFNSIFMSSSSSSAQSTNSSPPSIRSVENEMEEVLFSAPLIEFEHEEIVENTMVEWDDVSDLMNIDPVAMVEQANSDLNQIIVEINAQQVVENIITREIDGKQCTITADKMLNMNDDETNIIDEVSLQNVTNAIIVDNNMQDTTSVITSDRVNGINEVDIIQHTNIMNGGMQHADDIYFSPGNANQHWEIQRDDKFLTEAEQRTSLEEFEGNYPSRGVYRVSVIQKAPQTNGTTFGPDDVTNISSDGMIMTESEEMCSDESWNDYTLTCLSTLENNLVNPILLGETGQTESNNDDESIVLHYSETSSVAVLQPVTEHNTIEDNIAYNCSHCNEKVVSFKKLSSHLQQHSINDWLTCNNDKQNHLVVNNANNNNNTVTADNNNSVNKNNSDDDKSSEDDDNNNKNNNNNNNNNSNSNSIANDKKNNVVLILSEEQQLNGGCQINLIGQKLQHNAIESINNGNGNATDNNNSVGKAPTGVDDERELNEKIESYVQQQYHSSAIAADNGAAAAKQQKADKIATKAEVPRPITMEMSVHNEQADTRDVSVYVKSEMEPEPSISREHRISLSIQTVPKTTVVTAPTVTSSSLPATNTSKIVTVPKDLILPDGTLDISKLAESTREFLLNRNFYRCSPQYKPMPPVVQQEQLYSGGASNAAQNYPTLVEILTGGTTTTGSGTNGGPSAGVTQSQTGDESDERPDSRYSQNALECAHCNVSFFNKTDLLNHLSTHFIFQCPQCFERFANKQNLDHHVSKNKCNLRCKVMKVVTSTKNSEVLYECNYCHSQFIGMKDLNEHLKTHAILIFEKPPPSTVTLPPISSFADVTKSVSITIVTTNDVTTNSGADVATTTIYSAAAGNTDNGTIETTTKTTPCLSIISGANVSPSRKRWRKTEPPPIPFVCTRCDRVFNRKQDLKNHERHHFSPERYYRCSFCSITLKSKEDLEGHIKQHAQTVDTMAKNNRYPFRCVNCEQLTFSSLDQLTSHLDTHLPKGVYECAECCLRFRHKEMFKSHMRGHVLRDNARIESTSVLSTSKDKKAMKDWGVRCNFCSAVFTSQAERNRHTKTHENDENTISRNLADPSNCIYCNGKLETISDIIHHIRLHTDERKQFPCSICDRKIIAERNENTEPGNAYYCNYCIQKMNEYRQPPSKSNNGTVRTAASTIKSVSSSRSVKKKIIAP